MGMEDGSMVYLPPFTITKINGIHVGKFHEIPMVFVMGTTSISNPIWGNVHFLVTHEHILQQEYRDSHHVW